MGGCKHVFYRKKPQYVVTDDSIESLGIIERLCFCICISLCIFFFYVLTLCSHNITNCLSHGVVDINVNMHRATVSLCKTPANNSKNSVSLSTDKTFAFVPLNDISIALTICSGLPYALKIFDIFRPQCILSKAFSKSMKNNVVFDFSPLLLL